MDSAVRELRATLHSARVRYRRKALRLTRKAVATLCGVHAQYIGQIERGRANPTVLLAARLSRVLDFEFMLLEVDARKTVIGQASPDGPARVSPGPAGA